jgi:2'-5' RNA ligase
VVVWPTPEVTAVLAALPRPAVEGVTWSAPEQWMVKLRPLGHVDPGLVPALRDALAADLDGAPAARCELGPRTVGRGWLYAPVSGLDDLSAVVFEATEELVPVTHPQPFMGAVALARGRVPRELAGEPVTAAWTARRVALVADRSSPRAPRFEELATFPLGA